jgi:broad specificity polyphosphatase/5'/3'-nucleotidase SurE
MQGNMFLNLNIPENWNGTFQTVPLGARWYHNATDMIDQKSMGVAFEVGAARIVDEEIEMTDCHAIASGSASITPLASWPQNHPLGVPQSIMQASTVMDPDGMPSWL